MAEKLRFFEEQETAYAPLAEGDEFFKAILDWIKARIAAIRQEILTSPTTIPESSTNVPISSDLIPANAGIHGHLELLSQEEIQASVKLFGGRALPGVDRLRITADDKRVIATSRSKDLYEWDITSQELLGRLIGHTDKVNDVAASLDGKYVISVSDDQFVRVSEDKNVKIGDDQSKHLIKEINLKSKVLSVAISPDGKFFVVGNANGFVNIYSLPALNELKAFNFLASTGGITSLAISKDGETIFAVGQNGTLLIADVKTEQIVTGWINESEGVTDIALTPDERAVVLACKDNNVRVLDLETYQIIVLSGHVKPVTSVAVTPDGKYIVSTSKDPTLRIWDIVTGKELRKIDTEQEWASGVAITSDGKYVFSNGSSGILEMLQIAREIPVQHSTSLEAGNSEMEERMKEVIWDAHSSTNSSIRLTLGTHWANWIDDLIKLNYEDPEKVVKAILCGPTRNCFYSGCKKC